MSDLHVPFNKKFVTQMARLLQRNPFFFPKLFRHGLVSVIRSFIWQCFELLLLIHDEMLSNIYLSRFLRDFRI